VSQCGGRVPRHKGDSAVVRQSGLGGFPQEELPKGFPDLRQLSSTGVSDAGVSLARVKSKKI